MSKEAMKLALEALLHCKDAIVERGLNGSPEFAEKWGLTLPLERADQAITALREALAQERSSDEQPAQQEPVACVQDLDEVKRKHLVYEKGMEWKDPLYASPPAQRTWEEWFKWWRTSKVADSTEAEIDFADFMLIVRAVESEYGIKENT